MKNFIPSLVSVFVLAACSSLPKSPFKILDSSPSAKMENYSVGVYKARMKGADISTYQNMAYEGFRLEQSAAEAAGENPAAYTEFLKQYLYCLQVTGNAHAANVRQQLQRMQNAPAVSKTPAPVVRPLVTDPKTGQDKAKSPDTKKGKDKVKTSDKQKGKDKTKNGDTQKGNTQQPDATPPIKILELDGGDFCPTFEKV